MLKKFKQLSKLKQNLYILILSPVILYSVFLLDSFFVQTRADLPIEYFIDNYILGTSDGWVFLIFYILLIFILLKSISFLDIICDKNQKVKKILLNKGALIGFILSIISGLFLSDIFSPLSYIITRTFFMGILFSLIGLPMFIVYIIDVSFFNGTWEFLLNIIAGVLIFSFLTFTGSFSYLLLENAKWSKIKRYTIFSIIIILYLLLNFIAGLYVFHKTFHL